MISSWRLPAFDRTLVRVAAVFFAALAAAFFYAPAAEAAGCQRTPVSEQGGQHWCYRHDASKGSVHIWKPADYKADTAFTAIYIHGHDLKADPCPSEHYIDCAWDAHKLAQQFKNSGRNALFVAIEGMTLPGDGVKWGSLGSLLTSIGKNGGIEPPQTVTVLGHSAGMYTAKALWGDARVKHLVTLDWLKGNESTPLYTSVEAWYRGGADRKLTIVSGSSNQTTHGTNLATKLGCPTVTGTAALSEPNTAAKCLHMKGVPGGHMGVVTGAAAIPVALTRSGGAVTPGSGGGGTTSSPSSPSGIVTTALSDANLGVPILEIPIPNVSFTDAIRENGQVTIPWLAQYVGGVYTFLLSIVGLVAAVMMVVGGFQYLTAGGDQGRIGAGKKRIMNALSGLVLALSSYAILYTINPDLVAFDGLKISGVQTSEYTDSVNGSNEGGLITATETSGPVGRPSAICNSEATCKPYCDKHFSDPSSNPQTAPGMASPNDVQVIPSDIPGVNGFGKSTSPATIALLRKVGPMFAAEGYKLAIGSGYRDLRGQIKLACEAYRDGLGSRVGKTIANPGGSFHGVGFAIDVTLWKAGKQITMAGNSTAQQKEDPAEARYLAEKMLQAGFRRLNNEIWHFEPATAPATSCRCYKIEECTMPPNVRCP